MIAFFLPALFSCSGDKHEFASEWTKDATDHWHACITENHTDVADKGSHEFDAGTITKQATESEEGVKTYTCTVCEYKKNETIAKLPHTHTFDLTTWANDEENHWHPATCGHTDEKNALAAHTWDEGRETTPATEKEEGVKTYTCTVCERTKEETIPVLPHTHTFDLTTWTKDETGHWHAATCEHTDQKQGFAAHSGTWSTKTAATYGQNEIEQRDCDVCGFHEEKEVSGTALAPKSRDLSVAAIANITFDGLTHPIDDSLITRTNDEGGLAIEYRLKGTETYSDVAPDEVGTYEYRVTLSGTVEWEEKVATGEFVIEPLAILLTDTSFEIGYADDEEANLGNIYITEDGTDISTATNGWTDSVSLTVPAKYGNPGRYTIPVSEISLNDDNFMLKTGSIESVSAVRYDTKDLIAGVVYSGYVSSSSTAVVEANIEQGSIAVGDSLYVCELDKEVTVVKIALSYNSVNKVTVGDAADVYLRGSSKGEIKQGMVLTKPNTIKAHQSAVVTLKKYTVDEGGTKTPFFTGKTLSLVFSGNTVSASARIALPSGTETINSGETATNVILDFSSPTGMWVGRTFLLKDTSITCGEGTITAVHDHAFDASSGQCECGQSNQEAFTFDNGESSMSHSYYLNESKNFTGVLQGARTSAATYQFSLLDATGNAITEGFKISLYSTLSGSELTLSSTNTYPVAKGGNLPVKVVLKRTGGTDPFIYCTLKIAA